MAHAFTEQHKHGPGEDSPGFRAMAARNAWMAAWLAGVGVSAAAWWLQDLALHLTSVALLAAGVVLTVQKINGLEQRIAVNTTASAGLKAGLEAATHYAFHGDGAAACPMGGGDCCPQSNGRHTLTDSDDSGTIARLLASLEEGPGARSHPR